MVRINGSVAAKLYVLTIFEPSLEFSMQLEESYMHNSCCEITVLLQHLALGSLKSSSDSWHL